MDFWQDRTTVTENVIAGPGKLVSSGKGAGERRERANALASSDVQSVFKAKTYDQLQVTFQRTEGEIRAGDPDFHMGN